MDWYFIKFVSYVFLFYSKLICIFSKKFYLWLQRKCIKFLQLHWEIHSFVGVWWIKIYFFISFISYELFFKFLCFCHRQIYQISIFFRYPLHLHDCFNRRMKILFNSITIEFQELLCHLLNNTLEKMFLTRKREVGFFIFGYFCLGTIDLDPKIISFVIG